MHYTRMKFDSSITCGIVYYTTVRVCYISQIFIVYYFSLDWDCYILCEAIYLISLTLMQIDLLSI